MTTKKMGAPLRFPPPTGDLARDRIINLRRRLGLSQAALADRLNITQQAIQCWEDGRNVPSGPALKLLEQLEDEAGNMAAPQAAAPDQRKHRSIGEMIRRAKSTERKKEYALEWAKNWEYEQKTIISRLKRAIETGAHDFLVRALRELDAVTEKRLGALPRVIDLLLEGVEDDPPD